MRTGITLLELLIVVVIIGIIASIAVPQLVRASDDADVRDEVLRVVAVLDATRGAAIRLNSVGALSLTASSYRATAIIGSDTVVALDQPGPARHGVAIGGSGTPLLFGPAGIAMGVSNRTITISKGSALRKVVVSKLGRITY